MIKFYVYAAIIIGIVAALAGYGFFMYNRGVQSEVEKCNNEKVETINDGIKFKLESDNIPLPTRDEFFDWMRGDTA